MSEQGSSATSMRQLARACDVQVAALYHYFDSKEALLAAVIAERNYGSRLAEPLDLDRGAPAPERLSGVFRAMWDGAIAEESVWRLLLGEGIRSEPAALPVGQTLLDAIGPAVAGWVADWVPELADPEAVADVLLGLMFFGFLRHMFEPDTDTSAIADTAEAMLVRVVLPAG